jgi:NAD(P)-dependent dehydrogenase (short-subunit alcohol dehydrogenase family)
VGNPNPVSTENQGKLERRTAVITGAAGGQGSAVAHRLVQEGARVVLSDSREAPLMALAEDLRATGAEALALRADVRDEAQVAAVIAKAVDEFGELDILYSNAGVYWPDRDAPVDRLERDAWDEILAINTTGAFLFCKHAVSLARCWTPQRLDVSEIRERLLQSRHSSRPKRHRS